MVCHGRFTLAGAWKGTSSRPQRKTRNRLASNNRPLAIPDGTGWKLLSRKISGVTVQASGPLCKVHGGAVVAVQVAMPLRAMYRTRKSPRAPESGWIEGVRAPGVRLALD